MPQWLIESVEISGGFLDGLSLNLPQGLICVIGPRGSGKSTLAEALRLAVGGMPSGAPKPRLDFIKANLGSSVLTLKTAPGTDRGQFVVRRTVGQAATITSGDGRAVTSVDLDRGTFLPLDAYSSLDIEGIADESLGAKRRTLLDDLCATEMQQIQLELADHRRALEANADAIGSAERRLNGLVEQAEEIGDATARLAALPPSTAREGSPDFQNASRQRQCNERELAGLKRATESFSKLRDEIAAALATAKTRLSAPLTVGASLNSDLLAEADAAVAATWPEVDRSVASVAATVASALTALGHVQDQLGRVQTEQEARYLELQQQNQAAVQAVENRAAAEREVTALDQIAKQRTETLAEIVRLNEQRRALKADYLLTRDRVAALREGVAARLQAEAGQKVQVRVIRNADALEYQEKILAALYGTKLKNQDEILKSLTRLRPEDLAQILRDDDLSELEAHASFGRERGRKILDALRQNLNPHALEILTIEDRVCIELNVATGAPANFKDAAELSRGQKCTALLPILLARRDSPLVIDQPEDNLDNHFIYETVVESIIRLRSRRQMVFITHNANIPVLGEADLVVVMSSDGRKGFVEKVGSVNDCRREIIDLLEGGEEAFELRRKRYGA